MFIFIFPILSRYLIINACFIHTRFKIAESLAKEHADSHFNTSLLRSIIYARHRLRVRNDVGADGGDGDGIST